MTLGRTENGAIKIKTDGGLRAVACACCGCECHVVSESLAATLKNASTTLFDGVEPFDSVFSEDFFFLQWDSTSSESGEIVGYEAIMFFNFLTHCIGISIFSSGNSLSSGPICACQAYAGTSTECEKGADIFVNGEIVPSVLLINPGAFDLITDPPHFSFS